ncbi:DUF2378 family protein [Corallococcus sp. CA049B]|uniref:DUF2378 family protein n=1 Tax=Corallococcus sp. CA049B TaxID=2316730 RepID=UPI001F340821|nr:DUF2378 family protein [Corallococcus sp. CA049B]
MLPRVRPALGRTLLGKALVSLWPIFGPDRVLSRLQESFATVNNYLKTELITHGREPHFDFNGHACSYRVRWDS